jgi:hypothetical protein
MIAVPGRSSRIACAACRPSVACTDGIRTSMLANSGRAERTRASSSYRSLPGDHVEAGTVEQAGETLAQQDIVVGQYDPGCALALRRRFGCL